MYTKLIHGRNLELICLLELRSIKQPASNSKQHEETTCMRESSSVTVG